MRKPTMVRCDRNLHQNAKAKSKVGLGVKRSASATASASASASQSEHESSNPRWDEDEVADVRRDLLSWYDHNHRVLPWRRTPFSKKGKPQASASTDANSCGMADMPDNEFAYCVWVSEMMLQQTQVETVRSYFTRWIARWPTVQSLAAASQEQVNDAWAGLGYYRRAKFLLEGARHVSSQLGGRLPRQVDDLVKIPGIGAYTASAISSIAFNRPVGVVDGNVIRVMARLRAIAGDQRNAKNTKMQWEMANRIVDQQRPGDFNQALMELGATVCTPKCPKCDACPISKQCKALDQVLEWNSTAAKRERGIGSGFGAGSVGPQVTDYPHKVERKPPRKQTVRSCVLVLDIVDLVDEDKQNPSPSPSSSQQHFVLLKRPDKGLLAGLWELPNIIVEDGGCDSEENSKGTMEPKASAKVSDDTNDGTVGRSALISHLHKTLGTIGIARHICREDMREVGSFVHVFSHIKQKNLVDCLVVQCTSQQLKTVKPNANSNDDSDGIKLVSVESNFKFSTSVMKAIKLYGERENKGKQKKETKSKAKVEVKPEERKISQYFRTM